MPQRGGQPRRRAFRGEHIRLDLAQGHGAFGRGSVGMEDGVVGVFPALMHEAADGVPGVLDEAVAVGIAPAIHPLEGALDVRPELAREREISRPFEVRAGENDEERRGVDAPVVPAEGNLAEVGHLAAPRFVEHLARLGVAKRVGRPRLMRRQEAQHAAGRRRIEPQKLQGGEDAVPPEGRAEPRHAGERVDSPGRARHHHSEIGGGSAKPGVESLARCANARSASRGARSGRSRGPRASTSRRGRRPATTAFAPLRATARRRRRTPPATGASRRASRPRGPAGRSRRALRRRAGATPRASAPAAGARARGRGVPRTSKMSAKSDSTSRVSRSRRGCAA